MIDIHTHIGKYWGANGGAISDEAELLRQMEALGISQMVLHPLGMTPECFAWGGENEVVLEAYRRHPDRFIPFCNIDARTGNSPNMDFTWMLEYFKAAGCRGMGELFTNLPFNDPLCMNLYRQCGKIGFPVLFHLAVAVQYGLYGVADERGMPRLEKTLQECSQTIFIGHAPAFWSEVAVDVTEAERGGYPHRPVKAPGRTVTLLKQYPNLYGDLSADSGFNALSRDPEFGYRFLEECQDKLLFGTDICHLNQKVEIVDYLNQARDDGKISQTAYHKVTRENAVKLLRL